MSVETIARALDARKVGTGWMACCPAHDDRDPSLSFHESDGVVLVHCRAGCDQSQVIAALKERGLWHEMPGRTNGPVPRRHGFAPDPVAQRDDRSTAALAVWTASMPATGTSVENYLAGRGLSLPLPPSLRFHSGLKHPSGGFWPYMVAAVTRGDEESPLAIHRTFLARHGDGKAPVDPVKMMLGPCRGGAVRLGEPSELFMVGEGIETCLAAMQATGYPAWAALSAPGMRILDLPNAVREVIVLADGDDPGEAAASDCARRWKREGRRVRVAHPPRGQDFLDVLVEGISSPEVAKP